MANKSKHITVFGSYFVDLMARGDHLPLPGETVKGTFFKMGSGGKGANQAIAAKRAGANVTLISKIGNDNFGNIAKDVFKQENLSDEYLFVSNTEPTGNAIIMVDENTAQNSIMVTSGACDTFSHNDIEKVKPLIDKSKFLLTQLETNIDAVKSILKYAKNNGVTTILNTAPIVPLDDEILSYIDIITPNEVEASALTGVEINTTDDAIKASNILFEKGIKNVIITLGKKGALIATKDKCEIIGIYDEIKPVDTTGAGDAFNGGLVTALSRGLDIFSAARYANVVSNLAVSKMGAGNAMPYENEINDFIEKYGYK